jgi:lysophospholipase L1-like esterase
MHTSSSLGPWFCVAAAAAVLLALDCSSAESSESATTSTVSAGGASTGGAAGHAEAGASTSTGGGGSGVGAAGAGGSAPLVELNVWLIGDSTVATGSGWGDFLQPLLDAKATVINRARSGESTMSFYEAAADNLWSGADNGVIPHLGPGDYVLIQFGHNDEHDDPEHHTDPGAPPDYQGTFRQYLELYVDETRAAGGTPILVTPVCRMWFNADGSHIRDHGDYPAAMIKTAEDKGVVLLDLEAYSHDVFETLGELETLELFSDGTDRTHFPPDKAWRVAEFVTALLAVSPSPLAAYVL